MKIKSIEVWRFLFACSIVLCHSMYLPQNYNGVNLHVNSLGVEFFFILSGFLMARSVFKIDEPCMNIGKETVQFILKKLKPIYIVFLIAAVIELLSSVFIRRSFYFKNIVFRSIVK